MQTCQEIFGKHTAMMDGMHEMEAFLSMKFCTLNRSSIS